YRLFGVSEELSFIFNNLIFGLTIFVVFLLGLLIFDNQHTGLWSAFIYVLVPQNILWFNTTAAEPSSTFWTAFAIFSVFLFMKYQKNSLLFLVACVLSFSLNFRPESILLLLIVLTAIFLFQQKLFMEYRFYVFGILIICLLIPLIGHHYAVRMENWGSFGDKFSFSYFKNNFIANASFYFKNIRFPVIYSLLALFGLLSKTKCKEISILVLWFLLFWGIFLFFYAGSYNYGVDVRFSLLSYVPFVLLSGYGLYRIQILLNKWTKNIYISFILVAVLALSFLPFMSMLRAETQEAWAARKDHKYAKEFAELLPENSIILTHNPNMFLVWGKNAAQTSIANNETTYVNNVLFQRYSGGMFFHWNYWCNVPDSLQNSFCEQILQSYDCKLIKEKTEKQYRYAIYQLKRAK
ncbi:MAG: glycosyltransferase family 39 protein, partial [Candidatus Hodarchaeota archaeon]